MAKYVTPSAGHYIFFVKNDCEIFSIATTVTQKSSTRLRSKISHGTIGFLISFLVLLQWCVKESLETEKLSIGKIYTILLLLICRSSIRLFYRAADSLVFYRRSGRLSAPKSVTKPQGLWNPDLLRVLF